MAKQDPQPYERASTLSKKQIIVNNLIGGIAWGLGATVGIALLFAILGFIGRNVDLVPVVGTFVSDIIDFILMTNPNLKE